MESYYEINVALDGKHLFATAHRSCKMEWDLERVLPIIKQKFPKEEGYNITITHWKCTGHEIDICEEVHDGV